MADEPITQDTPVTPDVAATPEPTEPAPKTFTQDDIDKIVTKRLARERTSWQSELEAERQRAQMTAEDQLKADLAAERTKSQTAIERANQRTITAEARAQAAALGIKPERMAHALRLADLSGVEVGDDGEPDTAAIAAAIGAVLTDIPELKGAPASVGGSSNPPGAVNAGKLDVSALSAAELTALQKRVMAGERVAL